MRKHEEVNNDLAIAIGIASVLVVTIGLFALVYGIVRRIYG